MAVAAGRSVGAGSLPSQPCGKRHRGKDVGQGRLLRSLRKIIEPPCGAESAGDALIGRDANDDEDPDHRTHFCRVPHKGGTATSTIPHRSLWRRGWSRGNCRGTRLWVGALGQDPGHEESLGIPIQSWPKPIAETVAPAPGVRNQTGIRTPLDRTRSAISAEQADIPAAPGCRLGTRIRVHPSRGSRSPRSLPLLDPEPC